MSETTLGQVISKQRKVKGLTQFELAEQMGVSDKAVSKWERDASCPDVASFAKLATILEVSSDELLARVPVKTSRARGDRTSKVWNIVRLVLIAVGLAMGVAVAVLNILGGAVDSRTSFILLGIGMACLGMYLFDQGDDMHNF